MTQAPDTIDVTLVSAAKVDGKFCAAGAVVPVHLSLAVQMARDGLIDPLGQEALQSATDASGAAAVQAELISRDRVAELETEIEQLKDELAKALDALDVATRSQAGAEKSDGASPPSASDTAVTAPKKGAAAKKA